MFIIYYYNRESVCVCYLKYLLFIKANVDIEDRIYEKIPSYTEASIVLEQRLSDYNATSNKMPFNNLVFFNDAIEHISRISRILRQPRGNAMLVGVGGSGKQTMAKFAAALSGFSVFEIELTRTYSLNEFREDLKKLYHSAGIDGKSIVFLFKDTQIVSESFLEDINNMLNSGEVLSLPFHKFNT